MDNLSRLEYERALQLDIAKIRTRENWASLFAITCLLGGVVVGGLSYNNELFIDDKRGALIVVSALYFLFIISNEYINAISELIYLKYKERDRIRIFKDDVFHERPQHKWDNVRINKVYVLDIDVINKKVKYKNQSDEEIKDYGDFLQMYELDNDFIANVRNQLTLEKNQKDK